MEYNGSMSLRTFTLNKTLFCPLFLLLLCNPSIAHSCATDVKNAKHAHETAWSKYWKSQQHAFHSKKTAQKRTPSSFPTQWSASLPWGGTNTNNWKAEAVLANAVNQALDSAYSESDVQDVQVSVPMKMIYGNTRPYGDGQTNATMMFGDGWTEKTPPLFAVWSSYSNGSRKLRVQFHSMPGINLSQSGTLIYFSNRKKFTRSLSPKKISDQDYEMIWNTDQNSIKWGDLFTHNVAYIQVPGRGDWFPIDFRQVSVPAQSLLQQVPESKRAFGIGNLLDPEKISVQGNPSSSTIPFDLLNQKNIGAANINATRYTPVVGIHNNFSYQNGSTSVTAVGNGDTTVMLPPSAPFKMAYICFDPRNPQAEAQFGVPSGGGWHEIGDAAETVFNTLENAAPIFGHASGIPGGLLPSDQVPGSYAYGLTDVSVIQRLKPGQAIVTGAGSTTFQEGYSDSRGKGQAAGRNYHWFVFDQPHEVCAMEWVHPCVPGPGNNLGLRCN